MSDRTLGQGGAGRHTPISARQLAVRVLTNVEQGNAYSHLELERNLRGTTLSAVDTGLVTELVYGTMSRQNTLDFWLERFVSKRVAKLQPWVRMLLRISVYQMVYLDRIPEHAVVHEAVKLAKRLGHQGIAGMVNGVLRSMLRNKQDLCIPEGLEMAQRIALEHSHPQWLVERWLKRYGEETTTAICQSNNESPLGSVRVNTTVTTRERLMQEMEQAGIEVALSHLSPQGVIVRSGGSMVHTSWYRDGVLSIQDESSMLVAEVLALQPGMHVLDCCAAPGGKTTHIAEKMQGKGRIIANDIHSHKRALVESQARRLGLSCIEAVSGDALELPQRYAEASFDRILLDAPCSGLGVIRRKPDVKWNKCAEHIRSMAVMQAKLLERIAPLLKLGGILVYSTCTIEPEENGEVISNFLNNHSQYRLAPCATFSLQGRSFAAGLVLYGEIQIFPHCASGDGFYIARLQRIC